MKIKQTFAYSIEDMFEYFGRRYCKLVVGVNTNKKGNITDAEVRQELINKGVIKKSTKTIRIRHGSFTNYNSSKKYYIEIANGRREILIYATFFETELNNYIQDTQ